MKLGPHTTFSHYKILSEIGRGGMGEVYLAQDTKLDRKVALKILPEQFAKDKDRMSRFVREAKSASALNHPNIITIYEIGETDNIHYIATEYIDGETLSAYSKAKPVKLSSALDIAIQVSSALDEAHQAGIVHRDIKPDNVMIRSNGLAKILDFGIAKVSAAPIASGEAATAIQAQTQAGMILGTPNYMSPEQARGKEVDHQTDIFSFGVVLYEMLSGSSPFAGDTVGDVIAAVLTKEPESLSSIPAELNEIINKTLQKETRNRYQTAKDLSDDLKKVRQDLEIRSRQHKTSQTDPEEPKTRILPIPTTDEKLAAITDSEEGFRVAVLPFKYPSANAGLESLAEGLSEEIVTGLSRFSYLRVIARGSTLNYESNGGDVRKIGEELGARFVMDGSLRQVGAIVRLSAQLVDAETGEHLWAETYDRTFTPEAVFDLQDELVPQIVSTVADWYGVLPHSMSEAVRFKPADQLSPYEAILRSFGYFERINPEEHSIVRDGLERAVKQAPGNADGWAMLSMLYGEEYRFGFNVRSHSLDRSLQAAQQAIDTAHGNHFAWLAMAQALFFRKEFDSFRDAAERAVSLNSLDGATIEYVGHLIAFSGDWERGCDLSERARNLNPNHPGWYWTVFFLDAYRQGDYETARTFLLKCVLRGGGAHVFQQALLTALYGQLGDLESAQKTLNQILELSPDFLSTVRDEFAKWYLPELVEQLMEGLRKAGLESASKTDQKEQKTQILEAKTTHEQLSPSIAVLPFTNMSADEENEYFCDGLAEELINALSKIEDLKVAARTSAFSFKGKNTNVSEIGGKLGVEHVLEGSVRKSGNNLRITVQLVNASDGYQIWSERYDREMEDIFDVQDEITLAVVDALKLQLFGEEKAAVLKRYTNNAEAYQLYLKGRFYFDKFTLEGFEKSVEYYEQALAKEPRYAPAFAALSKSYNFAWYVGYGETAKYISEAKAAVEKALALDQTLAEAHHSLALIKFNYERDWTGAEKAFRRALELNYSENHEHYSMFLAVLERSDEAVVEAKRTVELTPLAFVPNYIAGWGFWFAGRGDLAKEQGDKLLEMEPNFSGGHVLLGMNMWDDGTYQKALGKLETAVNLGAGNDIRMLLGLMYGMEGEREKANQLLNEFQRLDEQGTFTANQQAFIYAGLGEMDRAFDLLELAIERHEGTLPFLKQFSSLYPKFHNDPRMTDLLYRVGLPTDKTNQTDESPEAKPAMLQPDTAEENTDVEPTNEPTTNPKPKSRNPKSKWYLFGLLGLIVLVGGFFGYQYFTSNSKQIESIAVMPFVNESGDSGIDYLSDGITETLISSLTEIPNLSVKARSTVFYYKEKNKSPQEIGEELKVEAVLLGRISQRNEDIKLSLELVDTRTLDAIWSESYNRKVKDLVSLQSEIAGDISRKLRLKLTPVEQQRLAKSSTENSEAQQAYLKGRFHWNNRSEEDFEKAIGFFERAIEKDPDFALAYTGLADTYSVMPGYGAYRPSEYMPKARQAAQKALELDDELSEAHTSLGAVLLNYDFDWAGAEKEYRRAIELNPDYPDAHFRYATLLSLKGSHDDAIREISKALELDPLSLIINRTTAMYLHFARRYDEAVAQVKRYMELYPDRSAEYFLLGEMYSQRDMDSEAVESFLTSFRLDKGIERENLRRLEVAAEKGGLEGLLREMLELDLNQSESASKKTEAGYFPSRDLAHHYARLKNKEKTLEFLNKAYDERAGNLLYIKVNQRYDFLREDLGFKALIKRIGFPE